MAGSLDELIDGFADFDKMMPYVTDTLQKEMTNVVQRQFMSGKDPYGRTWAPKKRPAGQPSFLQVTGRMRRSLSVIISGHRIVMTIDDPAGFHQGGTKFMPARRIFPVPELPLPPTWEKPIAETVFFGFASINSSWTAKPGEV